MEDGVINRHDNISGRLMVSAPASFGSIAVRLASGRRVVTGSPAYFARFGIPQTPSDLARHKCLAFNKNGERRPWQFMHKGRTINVRIDGPLDCNDGNLLHQGTLEGLGLQWRSLWEIRSVEHLSQTIFVGDRLLNESRSILSTQ